VIRTSEYDISEVKSDRMVREFLSAHHYLKTTPPARFKFCIHKGEQLVGVAVFAHPTNDSTITKLFGCPAIDGVELSRLVLLDEVPGNGESFFVGECLRRLKRIGLAGVVSFSDPLPRWTRDRHLIKPGHVGTVYQSLNSVFLGRSTPRTLRLLPNGTILSDRTIQKLRAGEPGTRAIRSIFAELSTVLPRDPDLALLRKALDRHTTPVRHPGNYKYCWGFTRTTNKMLPKSLPYPKLDPLFWAARSNDELIHGISDQVISTS
jgi:hypothetical protein